jgi:di/tricarboxylate transporter
MLVTCSAASSRSCSVEAMASTSVHGPRRIEVNASTPARTVLAIVGAVVVTSPAVGAVSLADAIDDVPWNPVLLVAATLALGDSLVSSGAANRLADVAFGSLQRGASAVVELGGLSNPSDVRP